MTDFMEERQQIEEANRRTSDIRYDLRMSFQDFCAIKEVPEELKIKFLEFFKRYFDLKFVDTDNKIFTSLTSDMEYGEIKTYYKLFITQLRNSI